MLYAGMTEHQMNLFKKGLFEQDSAADSLRRGRGGHYEGPEHPLRLQLGNRVSG